MGRKSHYADRADLAPSRAPWIIETEDFTGLIQGVAWLNSYEVGHAAFEAACRVYPANRTTFRMGARIIEVFGEPRVLPP